MKKNLKVNFRALPKGQLCAQERESQVFFDFLLHCSQSPTKLKIVNVLHMLSVCNCTVINNALSTGRCFELSFNYKQIPFLPTLFFAFFGRRDGRIGLCCPGCLGAQYEVQAGFELLILSPHLHTGAGYKQSLSGFHLMC